MKTSIDIETEILSQKTVLPGALLEELGLPGVIFVNNYAYLWLAHCGDTVLYFHEIWNTAKTNCSRKSLVESEFIKYLLNGNWY